MVRGPRVEHRQHTYDVRCEWGGRGVEHVGPGVRRRRHRGRAVVLHVGGRRHRPRRAGAAPALADPYGDRDAGGGGRTGGGAGGAAGRRTGRRCGRRRCSTWPRAPSWRCRRPTAPRCASRPPGMAPGAGGLPAQREGHRGEAAARAAGGPIGVVPAGERWPDGTLRVAAEDALGAGAIVAALRTRTPGRTFSPEAELVAAQFAAAVDDLPAVLSGSLGPRADRRRLRRRRRAGRRPRRQHGGARLVDGVLEGRADPTNSPC